MNPKISNERTKPLFWVSIPVELMPEHPRYFDLEGGYLEIWIFADDSRDAALHAAAIVDELPYRILDESRMVVCENGSRSCAQTEFQKHANVAYDLGLSMMLRGIPIGEAFSPL